MSNHDGHDDDERRAILEDPRVQQAIERSLAPYVGVAPPSLLESMRKTLEEAMTTHPYALGLIRALRERRPPAVTTEGPRAGAPDDDVAAARPRAGGSGSREGS
jgi:hypothetical protein